MRSVIRIFVFWVAVALTGFQAAAVETLELRYDSSSDPRAASSGSGESQVWNNFGTTFDSRITEAFASRFHPFRTVTWNGGMYDVDSVFLRNHTSDAAVNALSKSVLYSSREAAVGLPIMNWLEMHQGFLGDLLENTVDDVDEEAVSPLGLSYSEAERSRWQRLAESRRFRYGLRPLGTEPYAFVSRAITDGDRILIIGHARYRYHSFSEHRFEVALSVPLAQNLSVDLGSSYQFGAGDQEKQVVLKLFKAFANGSILHIGMKVQEKPQLLAGFAMAW